MPSSKISQILNSTHEGDGFYYKLLEEAYFIVEIQILKSMHEGDGFYYKLLEEAYIIVEMTGPTTVQPASSDSRKASLVGTTA